MPFWLKNSVVVMVIITIAAWFAGERIRVMDERYLLHTIREDKSRQVRLLSGLVAIPVVSKDINLLDIIIKEHLSKWPEVTMVHINDDRSMAIYEWQKKPIQFSPTVRHFIQPVLFGNQEFGSLSVYFDLQEYFSDVEGHIRSARQSAASILLAITLILVFPINYITRNKTEGENA